MHGFAGGNVQRGYAVHSSVSGPRQTQIEHGETATRVEGTPVSNSLVGVGSVIIHDGLVDPDKEKK